MAGWFRSWRFRRFVLGLVLATYLPVVSATIACQIACAMEVGMHGSAHDRGHVTDGPAASQDMAHLAHAGPCHLASVPSMCTGDFPLLDLSRAPGPELLADTLPASYVGPPPEHKPRT